MPISIPMETYERLQRFLAAFGPLLGKSTMLGRYVSEAVIAQMERDEQRLQRIGDLEDALKRVDGPDED